jgi:hypothetical protein
VCIFAYGQTGSGKTHTMSGTNTRQAEGRGINYRTLDDLFSIRDARAGEVRCRLRSAPTSPPPSAPAALVTRHPFAPAPGCEPPHSQNPHHSHSHPRPIPRQVEYRITVQMLEIYNETLRDLLVDPAAAGANRLDILSTQASGCNVPGAVQVGVPPPWALPGARAPRAKALPCGGHPRRRSLRGLAPPPRTTPCLAGPAGGGGGLTGRDRADGAWCREPRDERDQDERPQQPQVRGGRREGERVRSEHGDPAPPAPTHLPTPGAHPPTDTRVKHFRAPCNLLPPAATRS